jgi:amidohydrolase
MSAADTLKVTVYGRGGHGSMPQKTVDPVVLAAMIIVRLQTIVSREVDPGETAVLTVGSCQAGDRANVIPDHAVLQLNMRSYSAPTRERMLAAIDRIVRAECQAAGSPKNPDIDVLYSFPVTDNDPDATQHVAAAFTQQFGANALELPRQTVSEDFSKIPDAAGIPYTYWALGCTDPQAYRTAEKAGRVSDDIPANHSAKFLPVMQPTLRTGTEALISAALAWLAEK